jgi:WD40 repeat protein
MLNVITKAPVYKDFRCFGYVWVDLLKANIQALQLGYDLKALLPTVNAQSNDLTLKDYPASSPLLALRVTTNALAERSSYEGYFRGFTPDEQGLVTDSYSDGKSRLWSLSGTEQASFEGEFRGFTPDGKGLATDSGYGTVLWSLSGERLAEFTGRLTTNSGIDFTRFSDDGQYLITSLDDTTHQIWQLDNGLDDLLARGCNLLTNYFRANPGQREELGICLDQPL